MPRFVSSGGSNTSPYNTWATAATSLQTALTAATAGEVVVIQYNGVPATDSALAADVIYTPAASGVSIISASNDGGSAYTPTPMGTGNWIGHASSNRSISFAGTDQFLYTYGLTLRVSGSSTDYSRLAQASGAHQTHEDMYFWDSNSASGFAVICGLAGTFTRLINPTFVFGASTRYISCDGIVEIIGGKIHESEGAAPNAFITASVGRLSFSGTDLSRIAGTIAGNSGNTTLIQMERCKLGNGVTILAPQTSNPTRGSPTVHVMDCAYGDVQGFYGYYNALGQVETATNIYKTDNTTGDRSWKITTTANCNKLNPFTTPPIDVYHTGTSSITPYLEILRDGSSTPYTDNEVWAEITAKTTSGFVTGTSYNDRQALSALLAGTAGADQASGAGLGAWTGESGTAWSGKIDSGAAITPQEAGSLTAQVCVGVASSTVYVDPEIRGL